MIYLNIYDTEADYDSVERSKAKSYASLIAENGMVKYDKGLPRGVFIQHINGSLYSQEEWVSGGFTNDQANGVAIVSHECAFVIAKEDVSSSIWYSSDNKTLSDVTTEITSNGAQLDYNGAANTVAIAADDSSSAAYACANYIFPNGAKGYLPAAGELVVAFDTLPLVQDALSIIGGTGIVATSNSYWSSTQCSADSAWSVIRHYSSSTGSVSLLGRPNKQVLKYARAFTKL